MPKSVTYLEPQLIPPIEGGSPDDHSDWRLRAHDVKNIIASLMLVGEELEASDDDRTSLLGRRIAQCNKRILELCDVRPKQSASAESQPESRTVINILRDVLDLAGCIADDGTRLSVRGDADVWCNGTGKAFFRIFANLVTNAVLAVNKNGGGTIRIFCGVSCGQLTVHVTDNGPGMFNGQSSQATVQSQLKPPEGRGLGLMIAEVLSHQLGGKLSLVSSGRSGTTLRFVIPVEKLEREGRLEIEKHVPPALSVASRNVRVKPVSH